MKDEIMTKTDKKASAARVSSREFIDALKMAECVREDMVTMPVLAMTRVEFGPEAKVIATNIDQEITIPFSASGLKEFATFLHPKPIFTAFGGHDRLIDIDVSENCTTISDDGTSLMLENVEVEKPEFLEFKQGKLCNKFAISERDLHKALTSVAFAISDEETRYYLNGVFMTNVDGVLTMVATEGTMLCEYTLDQPYSGPSIIIPKDAIAALLKLINPNSDQLLQMSVFDRLVGGGTDDGRTLHTLRIDHQGWTLKSKGIDHLKGYPNWKKVIPKPSDNIVIGVSQAQVSRVPAGATCLKFSPSRGIASIDLRGGKFTRMEFPVEGSGDSFAVSPYRLKKVISALGDITLIGKSCEDPFIVETIPANPQILCVLMPMRVE